MSVVFLQAILHVISYLLTLLSVVSCEVCLGEFLQHITQRPLKVDFPAMANILVVHSQSSGNTSRPWWLLALHRMQDRRLTDLADQ